MADVEVDIAPAAQAKKRTFKKSSFKGVDLDTLLDVSTDELVKLFGAKARRRFQGGLKRKPMSLIKKLRKAGWSSLGAEGLALALQSVGNLREVQELLERCLDAQKALLLEDHIQEPYNASQETERKRALSMVLSQTKQQERKDTEVLAEAKRITESRALLKVGNGCSPMSFFCCDDSLRYCIINVCC